MVRKVGSRIYVYTDVEIDICDAMEAISDDDLLEEVKERKLEDKLKDKIKAAVDPFEMLEEVVDWLKRGDAAEALLVLDRIMHPKFSSVEICDREFRAARKLS